MAWAPAIDRGQLYQVMQAFEKTKNNDGRAIEGALRRAAQIVYELSQRYVPVDTGALKASGYVEYNGKTGLAAAFAVVYSAKYAIYVHERTDIPHHNPKEASAKYLERAARERFGVIRSLVRRAVQTRIN